MPRCFVIQPFDEGGPYDKRYADVLVPAIKGADLEPYRVDRDPATTIPIDDIEDNIRTSEICLADITPDSPNIWYEVGFAFANEKPVVMVCAKPRPTKAPFDVQHRHIIFPHCVSGLTTRNPPRRGRLRGQKPSEGRP
jgi:hypothetical protein